MKIIKESTRNYYPLDFIGINYKKLANVLYNEFDSYQTDYAYDNYKNVTIIDYSEYCLVQVRFYIDKASSDDTKTFNYSVSIVNQTFHINNVDTGDTIEIVYDIYRVVDEIMDDAIYALEALNK